MPEFDDAFLELLLRKFAPYIRSRIGNAADAEDVTQEFGKAVWQTLGSGRGGAKPRSVKAYCYGICNNLIKNYRRRKGRRPDPVGVSSDEVLHPSQPSPEQEARAHELLDAFYDALKDLGPLSQELVLARCRSAKRWTVIASELGISTGKARAKHHRALRRIEARLQKRYPDLFPQDQQQDASGNEPIDSANEPIDSGDSSPATKTKPSR